MSMIDNLSAFIPKKKRTRPRFNVKRVVAKPPQNSPPSPTPPAGSNSTSQRKRRNSIVVREEEKEGPRKKRKYRKNGGSKNKTRKPKVKTIIHGPAEPPPLPEETREFIKNKFGLYELRLLLQRKLYASDVAAQQNRFSIPELSLESLDFMSPREWLQVAERVRDSEYYTDENDQKKGKIIGKNVEVVEPNLHTRFLNLKQWDLNSSRSFVLTQAWFKVVKENNLKIDDVVQLWFFRSTAGRPCFALVKLPPC